MVLLGTAMELARMRNKKRLSGFDPVALCILAFTGVKAGNGSGEADLTYHFWPRYICILP